LSRSATTVSRFPYSLQAVTSTSTASTPLIEQRIEAVNVIDLVNGSTVTVSFYASQTSGTFMPLVVGLYYPTVLDTFSTQTLAVAAALTTTTLTGSLTYYTLTFTLTSGLVATNGLCLRFTTGTTASAGTFLFTGVQLEKGSTASPYEIRPYGTELALCQRYYYQLTSATPGAPNPTSIYSSFGTATGISSTGFWLPFTMPVPMRSLSYTITTATAANFQLYNGGSITVSTISAQTDSYTPTTLLLNCTVASGTTASGSYILRANNLQSTSIAYIGVSAEL
jgi:hypothetical protein